jgi:hypothetical protein
MHLIIEITELRYATSVRAFGPDKKPQFLERGLPRVNNHNRGTFICVDRQGIYKGHDKSGLAAKIQKPGGAREGGWRRRIRGPGHWRVMKNIREERTW